LIVCRNQTFIAGIYHREMDSSSRKLRQPSRPSHLPSVIFPLFLALVPAFLLCVSPANAQDTVFTGTSSGAKSIRIAVADFKPIAADPQTSTCKQTFDATFYADLANAGIFDIVSKSLMPPATPGAPSEVRLQSYADAPSSAAFVAFGSIGMVGSKLVVNGFLFDANNPQNPQVVAKQYSEDPTEQSARAIAHRFADEIILRLSGGTPGIAESTIYYVQLSGGNKEIWAMDYDGVNQRQITHLGTISMGPRVSPDNSRIAFESLGKNGFQIRVYSLILGRLVNFPEVGGTNITPAWSPDGREIAFSSSRTGDPEIWIADAGGNLARRITNFRGPDVSPTYNPKTGAQIAWVSGRTGLPQLYIMNSDGSGAQRLTDMGYATSPSWSPNGQFITFAWDRKYGPGAPGGQDIYVIQTTPNAKGEYPMIQLTHDGGRCDFPSWSPDGKHIVYANSADGRADHMRIWTMLADGTQRRPLTGPGADMPNWSWK
jgi:TolB protein